MKINYSNAYRRQVQQNFKHVAFSSITILKHPSIHQNNHSQVLVIISVKITIMNIFQIFSGFARRYFFCGSFMFLFCLVFALFCARLFICALWSPAGKGLTSWLSFVVSSVSLSLSHWYPGSGVVLDCIDS